MCASAGFYHVESVEHSGYRWRTMLRSLAVLRVTLVGLTGCGYESQSIGNSKPARVAEVKQALRDLWVGHIFWVRNVVSSNATNNLDERDAAEQQVLAHSKHIAHTMRQFYGDAISDTLCRILNSHYGAIREYSEATVVGNKSRQDAALALLESNVGELADLLSRVNPYLQKDTIHEVIVANGAHHIQQINLYKEKKYTHFMRTWGMMRQQVYGMADALTEGLVRQFPDKFS